MKGRGGRVLWGCSKTPSSLSPPLHAPQVCENEGTNPYFNEEKLKMWIDRSNWTYGVRVQVSFQGEIDI